MNNNKPTVEIREWYVDDYMWTLYGHVFGHYNFEDNNFVRTSSIFGVSKESDRFIVETRNTNYICLFSENKNYGNPSIDEVYKMLQKAVDNYEA